MKVLVMFGGEWKSLEVDTMQEAIELRDQLIYDGFWDAKIEGEEQ